MARRSQCSSAGDNPLDPNYLPPHYREEYRLAVDALVESGLDGYYEFLQKADVVDFLSTSELQYIQSCVRAPRQSSHPEQQQLFLDGVGDGSSDTYWPVHSDLDVPGLDLGWPQVHAFMEPTEVTTLVNPPEPDMPSIKEQARRLIKNAQQVVAVAMDVFTDVDMFADILSAAARRVAVYVLLDEQNAHHFVSMVANCRVNLDNFQFLRVRTVAGITYRCRSGRSFKGQMMDRFLLTDCRAVLSGNYSFMWSFEKLHRCMAHLFLGQLVTTFDEEFRILFAQSQPLIVENLLAPMEDLSFLQQKQYLNDNAALHRDPRKFLTLDSGHPDEWERLSYDKRMDGDRRMMALKKQDSLRVPADTYSRFGPQQSHMDPCFDQGPSRMLMTENAAFKRHSYAEGVHSRYSLPFMQGMPEAEPKGKGFHRGQQPYPGPAPDPDHGGYDRFWNQDYTAVDQYPEPYLPQEVPPPDNFDPVLNYLSSTRNLDFDQNSEKFPPAADLPYASPRSKRRGIAQPYACQTSPTPSNSAEQNQFLQDPAVSRKDPAVKQGLRNWRISSYLSAYENPDEEGLPLVLPQGPDAFEEPPRPIQQTVPEVDFLVPKMPCVKEFKVPAIPRPSQMPSYAKGVSQEKPKIFLDEPVPAPVEIKVTPTPSESSADGEKSEEPKVPFLTREDSFRRQYNAATQRSSRLRSSLIFSSLEQQQVPHETGDQPDEEKNKTEQTKLPFSHVSRQRKSTAREPLEWSRFMKPTTETSKSDDKDSLKEAESKDLSENPEAKEKLKQPDVESPSTALSKPSEAELPKTDQLLQLTKPFLTAPLFVDMSDADQRLMFFKELAAKRKAAEAAKAEKKKAKAETKPQTDSETSFQKREPLPNLALELGKASVSDSLAINAAGTSSSETETHESALNVSENTSRKNSLVTSDFNTSSAFTGQETKPFDSEKTKLDKESASNLPVPAETDASRGTGQSEFSKDSPSPSLPRSMSSEAKLPETDQSAEPTKSLRSYGDVNNPYERFMYFKQLAAKQKADEAAKDRSEIKPHVDPKTSLVRLENIKSLASECLLKKRPVVESSENNESTEPRELASLSFHGGDNTSRKNSVVDGESGSQRTDSDKLSVVSLDRRTSLEQTESASFVKDSPSPSLARSMSSDAKLHAADQLVDPTKLLHVDANNPYRRFLYFKELAGKQNATKAEKDKAEEPLLNVTSETKTHQSSNTRSEQETKLSENTVSDDHSVSAGIDASQSKLPEETNSDPFVKCPVPFLARSKSSEAEQPKTDQLVPPAKPLLAQMYGDMSDTEKRFTYFKELAAKRKAALAETERKKAEMKQVDLKISSVLLEDPNEAQKSSNALMSEEKSSGTTMSTEASECVSASSDENATKKDLLKIETPQTHGDQETQLFTSDETGKQSSESLAEPSVSDPAQKPAAPDDVSSGTCKTESLTPKSTSEGSVSDPPSSVESNSLETKTVFLLPSEQNTGSELNSSDQPLPDSGSQNIYSLTGDMRAELSDANETKAKESVSSSLQESSQKTEETLPEPDVETGLDSVPQAGSFQSQSAQETSQKPDSLISKTGLHSVSSENPSEDDNSVLGPDICPGSEPNPLHSTSSVECSVLAGGAELGQEEREASESSEEMKADGTYGPKSGLLGVSGPESSISKPDVDEKTPAPSHDFNPTEFDTPIPAEMVPSEPEQSVLSPEAERTEPDVSAEGLNTVSNQTPMETEPTPAEADLDSKMSETGKTSESQAPELAELGSVDTDDKKSENPEHQSKKSASSDRTNHQINQNDGSEPTKQPKPNPSRYHSSTANVLSSSNLRDDTKLLLGKISANCQSRNDTNWESPVTDDEKEDKNEKDLRRRTSSRGQAKPNPEREKVLEKFDSMRKEKRVYSRFMF